MVPVGMLASMLRLPSSGSKTATKLPPEDITASSSSSDAMTATLPVSSSAALRTSFCSTFHGASVPRHASQLYAWLTE